MRKISIRITLRRSGFLICALGAIPTSPIHARMQEPGPKTTTNTPAEIDGGLWPSQKLIELMLSRWVEESAYEYKLDDPQREKIRDAVVERWTKFLSENRDEIQPLANEFLEMRMEMEPPDKARVQEWARRARPVFDMTAKQMEEGTSEYRQVLRPDQRIRFEIDAMQLKLGLGMAGQKFDQWEKGEFEPDDFWEPIGSDREARRDERRKRRREMEARRERIEKEKQAAEQAASDPIDLEMDAWQRYVAEFISTYGLDAGQRDTVLSCLTELRDRALAHRDRHREEIVRLEEQISSNAGTEAELTEIKNQLERLYGPIDEMFKELQGRIEQVLTGDQRALLRQNEEVKPSNESSPSEAKSSPQRSEP